MRSLLTRVIPLAASVALATGCAGTGQQADFAPAEDQAVIYVDNENTLMQSATIYLVPETGVRQRLGGVNPDAEARFTVEPRAGFRYHLVADMGADELVSREFTFTDARAAEWDLDTNTLEIPPLG